MLYCKSCSGKACPRALLFLLFIVVAGGQAGASRKLLAAETSDGGEEDGGDTGTAHAGDVVYDAKKIEIWSQNIVDVIDHKLSNMCRTMIRAVKREGQMPASACKQLKDHKILMRMSCNNKDVEFMEKAVCGYWSIVLPTNSTFTVPLPSSSQSPLPNLPSSLEGAAKSLSSSSSSNPSAASTVTAEKDYSSLISPQPEEIAIIPIHDDPKQTRELPSHDSRLSDKCNQVLPHLAQVLTASKNSTRSGCKHLHHLALSTETESHGAGSDMTLPGVKVLLSSCTKDELHLLHGMLCAQHNHDVDPDDTLHGERQKRVYNVIKTELTPSCRDAVSPLGKAHMSEDAEDSCMTLRGAEGNQLVTNNVCTRRDLDNLLETVCDASSASATLGHHVVFMAALYMCSYIILKTQALG